MSGGGVGGAPSASGVPILRVIDFDVPSGPGTVVGRAADEMGWFGLRTRKGVRGVGLGTAADEGQRGRGGRASETADRFWMTR